MVFNFNKNDYKILSILDASECYSSVMSFTIKKISEETQLSIPKIRLTLKNFLIAEFIKEGAKEGVGKTFYITNKGVEFLNEAMQPKILNENEEE